MKLMLDFSPEPSERPIKFTDRILLMGSCFTEHIGTRMQSRKMQALLNPNGILFDPCSITSALNHYLEAKPYRAEDLFENRGAWHSWHHHSRFSHADRDQCLENINASARRGASRIVEADWLIITLGTSFSYRLAESQMPVANCHKLPARQFSRHFLTTEETIALFDYSLHRVFTANPKISILFTVSPVRHWRDGLMENSRSKARLLEAVHHLVDKFQGLYYFPAYEWVIDVLRDYRFYESDMVHPTEQAAEWVWEKFMAQYMDEATRASLSEMQDLLLARSHRPLIPGSGEAKAFRAAQLEKTRQLQNRYPDLDFSEELAFFSK